MSKRTTMADVAAHLGVSVATVSMALSDRPDSRIPEETKERVRTAAAELGYAPNAAARSLRTGRSRSIGFISDEVMITRFASAMIRGVLDVADERGHAVLMAETDRRPDRLVRAVDALSAQRIDGLVLGLMHARRITVPELGDLPPHVLVNGTAQGWPCILPNEFAAGTAAANHLIERGHRRIALIGRSRVHLEPAASATIARRMAGIDARMAASGLTMTTEFEGSEWEPDLGYAGANEILDSSDVTAVIAANDRVAFGVYGAAQDRGVSIPGDLSVISFDDEPLASYLRPQVTTLRLPYKEMGEVATTMVLDRVGDVSGRVSGGPLPAETLVPMPLVARGSVRDLTA